jgi:histidinol-phosphate aminotransferase
MMKHPVRAAAPHLAGVEPYDPKYIPAEVMISANENPNDVSADIRREIESAIRMVEFNRYPDPLANELRDMIAEANGLDRDNVIVGNGGDELLFNIALAYGGPGRTLLNIPPTFSVYAYNAMLTRTDVVDIPRRADFSIDEDAVVARLAKGDIDYCIITSPNNPTGDLASEAFIRRCLEASDALIMVDEAYFEFSRRTVRPLLNEFDNLVILRTFSKAFSLAGVRVGYLLAGEGVISEFKKVRQPYSVDAVSQAIARVVYKNRGHFERGVDAIIEQRDVLVKGLKAIDGVELWPSDSNYILVRLDNAGEVWRKLLDEGVLVRDFSQSKYLENCLRITVGSAEQNLRLLEALGRIVKEG